MGGNPVEYFCYLIWEDLKTKFRKAQIISKKRISKTAFTTPKLFIKQRTPKFQNKMIGQEKIFAMNT